MTTPHRTYVYGDPADAQVAVEVWPDAIIVKVRPAASAIWGLPLPFVSVEGDPVQFAFEEESGDEWHDWSRDWDSS